MLLHDHYVADWSQSLHAMILTGRKLTEMLAQGFIYNMFVLFTICFQLVRS